MWLWVKNNTLVDLQGFPELCVEKIDSQTASCETKETSSIYFLYILLRLGCKMMQELIDQNPSAESLVYFLVRNPCGVFQAPLATF